MPHFVRMRILTVKENVDFVASKHERTDRIGQLAGLTGTFGDEVTGVVQQVGLVFLDGCQRQRPLLNRCADCGEPWNRFEHLLLEHRLQEQVRNKVAGRPGHPRHLLLQLVVEEALANYHRVAGARAAAQKVADDAIKWREEKLGTETGENHPNLMTAIERLTP